MIEVIYKLLSIFIYLKKSEILKLSITLIIKVIIKIIKGFKWSLTLEKIAIMLTKYFLTWEKKLLIKKELEKLERNINILEFRKVLNLILIKLIDLKELFFKILS